MSKKGSFGSTTDGQRETKADRLAAALRDNLKKRKDLARQRSAGLQDGATEARQNREDKGPNNER